jgi:hypothetical protein
VFEKAVKIFRESGGSISNADLSKQVNVSPQTVANWKKTPEWSKTDVKEVVPEPVKAAVSRPAVDLDAIMAPQDLVALNEKLRLMLNREYLTSEDLENLAHAKLALLEAADFYLGISRCAGEEN